MRKLFALPFLLTVLAFAVVAGPAAAASDDRCHGVVSEVASTWPWAHEGKPSLAAPPPGGFKLWLEEFAWMFGVESVRDLQALGCGS